MTKESEGPPPALHRKELLWRHGEVKSPPFSDQGRKDAGDLLRDLQTGINVGCLTRAQ